jgi:hypothetical protein
MKVCRGRSLTEDPILHKERAGGVMNLLVSGPGLVLHSVPKTRPTCDGFMLELLL